VIWLFVLAGAAVPSWPVVAHPAARNVTTAMVAKLVDLICFSFVPGTPSPKPRGAAGARTVRELAPAPQRCADPGLTARKRW